MNKPLISVNKKDQEPVTQEEPSVEEKEPSVVENKTVSERKRGNSR